MLTKYIKRLNSHDCPIVLSITDTTAVTETETVIQRNHVRQTEFRVSNDIYVRARDIYFRARNHRPVRAAGIF
ncbi:MAG: hypothetical protein DMF63_04860 [Acidobacteria bacterium]|nr:MAG: hypothetical protein DMF63_04860 [Acidobacteriota bacterium]